MERRLVFLSGTIGVVLFVLTTIVGGALFPGYSHVQQLISESYAHGTPYGPWLRFLGYLPSGVLFVVFAWAAARVFGARKYTAIGFAGIGIGYGVGTVLAAFFPCEAGCQSDGSESSISQIIHNLSGLLTYLVVPASLVVLGVRLRKRPGLERLGRMALVCGIIAMSGCILLIELSDTAYLGIAQRLTEGSILAWILACALHFKEPVLDRATSTANT
jgi:hypothetical membrane protein